MYTPVESVIATRLAVRSLIVIVGTLSLLILLWQGAYALLDILDDGMMLGWRYYQWQLIDAAFYVALSVACLVYSGPLARKLVPCRPIKHCPGCGYELHALADARCPECSLRLPRSLIRQDSPTRSAADPTPSQGPPP